jgi:hypothetical protein
MPPPFPQNRLGIVYTILDTASPSGAGDVLVPIRLMLPID